MRKAFSLNKYRSAGRNGDVVKLNECVRWAIVSDRREVANGRIAGTDYVCAIDEWTNNVNEEYLRR